MVLPHTPCYIFTVVSTNFIASFSFVMIIEEFNKLILKCNSEKVYGFFCLVFRIRKIHSVNDDNNNNKRTTEWFPLRVSGHRIILIALIEPEMGDKTYFSRKYKTRFLCNKKIFIQHYEIYFISHTKQRCSR